MNKEEQTATSILVAGQRRNTALLGCIVEMLSDGTTLANQLVLEFDDFLREYDCLDDTIDALGLEDRWIRHHSSQVARDACVKTYGLIERLLRAQKRGTTISACFASQLLKAVSNMHRYINSYMHVASMQAFDTQVSYHDRTGITNGINTLAVHATRASQATGDMEEFLQAMVNTDELTGIARVRALRPSKRKLYTVSI